LFLILSSTVLQRPVRLPLAVVGTLIAVLGLACSGHAATAPPENLSALAVTIHGVAAAYWIGALAPLRRVLAREALIDASRVTVLFSKGAAIAIAALVIAGLALAVLQLGGFSALWETAYGRLFIAKLVLVAVLLALAAWNKWRLTPALSVGNVRAAGRLRHSISLELALAIAIIGLTAALGNVPPPRSLAMSEGAGEHSAHVGHGGIGARHLTVLSNGYRAEIEALPARPGPNTIRVRIRDSNGKMVEPQEVTLSLALPQMGIEPLTRPLRREPDGSYLLPEEVLSPAGTWHLRLKALISDFEKIVFEAELDIQ
jgi:copper transport protein